MEIVALQVLNSLSYAAVLFLIAAGLSLIFGVSGLVDSLGLVRIGGLPYPVYNLLMIGVGAVAALALWAFVYRTKFGVLLRATAQDRRMAAALGIDVGRIYVLAFGLGCFMAGLGGAIRVPGQAGRVGGGVEVLVIAFVVVVIGGLGSLEGALVGALIVSALRTITIQFWEEFELAALYLIAAIVLLMRPTGLFGRRA